MKTRRQTRGWKSLLACALAAVLLAGCRPVQRETSAEKAAREQKEAIEKLTRSSVTDGMARRFIEEKRDEMAVVPGLGDFSVLVGTDWSKTPLQPTVTALDVQKRVQEAGDARVDAAIQALREQEKEIRVELTAAAEAEHPMCKSGEKVELLLVRKGDGVVVSGTLGKVAADRAMIGNRMVPKIDMSNDDQTRIFPAEHAAMLRQIVDKQFARRLTEARAAAEAGRGEELRQALLAAGYVPDIAQEQGERVDARRWTSAVALVKRVRHFLQSPAGRAFDGLLDELADESDDDE